MVERGSTADWSHAQAANGAGSALCEEGAAEWGECVDDGVGEAIVAMRPASRSVVACWLAVGWAMPARRAELSGGTAVFDHFQAGGTGDAEKVGECFGPLGVGGVHQ
jgi:hypothetical protein